MANTHPFYEAFLGSGAADDISLAVEQGTILRIASATDISTRSLPRTVGAVMINAASVSIYLKDEENTAPNDGVSVIWDSEDRPFVRVWNSAGAASFNPRGAYDNGATYELNDLVTNQGASWVYLNATPGSGTAPPTLPTAANTHWMLVAAPGADGSEGAPGAAGDPWDAWMGSWALSTLYAENDAVENDGSSYICIQGHTSSADDEPGVGVNEATYWDIVAAKGADGMGSGDVTAAATFDNDNRLIRSDGTSKGVQASGVTLDDSDNMSGVSSIALGTALAVQYGGSGRASHTAYAVICGGTTSTAAQQSIASVGTSGQVLTSNGAGALPTFQNLPGTSEAIEFVIDGGGSEITTGVKGDLEIPFACTITRATALADQSGSIVVDIWKDTYANYPPTDADSITSSAPVTISTAAKSQDSTLTGWTTSISAGDILRFNVDSVTTITRCTVSLKVTK